MFLWFAQWSYFCLIKKWICFLSPLWSQSDYVWCWCSVRLCPTQHHDWVPKPAPDIEAWLWASDQFLNVRGCSSLSYIYQFFCPAEEFKIENSYSKTHTNIQQNGDDVNNSYIDTFVIWSLLISRTSAIEKTAKKLEASRQYFWAPETKVPKCPTFYKNSVLHKPDLLQFAHISDTFCCCAHTKLKCSGGGEGMQRQEQGQ